MFSPITSRAVSLRSLYTLRTRCAALALTVTLATITATTSGCVATDLVSAAAKPASSTTTLRCLTSEAAGFHTHSWYVDTGSQVIVFDAQFTEPLAEALLKDIRELMVGDLVRHHTHAWLGSSRAGRRWRPHVIPTSAEEPLAIERAYSLAARAASLSGTLQRSSSSTSGGSVNRFAHPATAFARSKKAAGIGRLSRHRIAIGLLPRCDT